MAIWPKGGAAITCAFSNMPKFIDTPANPGSTVAGKLAAALPPGTRVNGKLIRRSVLWFNLMAMVSTQSKYPEAAYLFLQWLGGSRIFSWMSSNPAGYFDPFQLANFDDPLVQQSYHPYQVANIRETIKRAVPTINYAGASSYHKALDDNLMAMLDRPAGAGSRDGGDGEGMGQGHPSHRRGQDRESDPDQPEVLADDDGLSWVLRRGAGCRVLFPVAAACASKCCAMR